MNPFRDDVDKDMIPDDIKDRAREIYIRRKEALEKFANSVNDLRSIFERDFVYDSDHEMGGVIQELDYLAGFYGIRIDKEPPIDEEDAIYDICDTLLDLHDQESSV